MSKSRVYNFKLCCSLCELCVLGRPRLARDQYSSSAGNWNVSEHNWELVTVNIHLAVSEQEGVEENMQNANTRFFWFFFK